ncbi:MAG: starch-binding protein [Bacteroidales bacterium]|nr:starch-binding protein [Bacteroidales bacterium]
MKKFLLSVAMLCMALGGRAETQEVCQGWPADYGGVMLQGFWWDSYEATKWSTLTARADELSQYFDLIWIPNSGTCSGDPNATTQPKSNGYDPCYWLTHNSIYGTEEELRTMINTYKAKNVGIIEDVVINHKKGVTNWCDFAQETVTGQNTNKVYSIAWDNENYSQICQSDECNDNGYHTTGANDTGTDFNGYRDLDHTNATTRANVKVYLDFLLHELGYAGFRYDMVKGYGAGYIQEYNNDAMPTYSVGEFWDNQTNIQNWIMGTGNTSAAFDFPLKFKMNEAISNGDYSAFEFKSFTFDKTYSKLSVTFADNHDTGRESSKLANNWSAANAFILASPGTPCVWYPHYNADPTNIRAMILARKACGITNTDWEILKQYPTENNSGYILETKGTKGSVYVQLGAAADDGTPDGYTLVAEGDAYKFYSSVANFASVKVSPDGGAFTDETVQVTLTPVNATQGAWYTIGSEASDQIPLTQETTITIGADYDVNEDITLFWGAKGDDGVEYTGSTTFTKREHYTPSIESADEVSVFFETEAKEVFIWAWDDNDVNYTGGDWDKKPAMDLMGVNDAGKLIYKWTYTSDLTSEPTKLLFVTEELQTPDFEFVNHGYYTESGLSYKVGENSVYLVNAAGWNDVYCYAWGDNGEVLGAWPGTKATYDSEQSCYTMTFGETKPTKLIWNNDNGEQTQDLSCELGKTYTNYIAYFKNTEGWKNVYCYAWDGDNKILGEWPGVQARANNDGLFYMVFTDDVPKNIIWNNNSGDQTADLAFENGEVYDAEGGEYFTLYFNNTGGWNEVYCYTWHHDNDTNADTPEVGWPGSKVTAKDYETASGGYYKALVNSKYENVIFNNYAGSQTKDLKVKDGSIYTLSDEGGSEGNGYWPLDNSLFFASSDKVEGINVVMNDDGFDYCNLFVLNDKVPFVNTKDFTALEVSYGRAKSAYKWGSIIMPFELTSDENIQYYTLKSVTDEQMTFSPVGEVEANTPAIYQVLGDGLAIDYKVPVEVKATGTGTASVQPISDWTMVGTYSAVPALESGDGKFVYYIGNDQFWLANSPVSVAPFRAWFETTNPINAAKLRIAVDDEPEGIQTIDEDKHQGEIIYDLMGRQQDWTRKGIVIKNGSVVFVK